MCNPKSLRYGACPLPSWFLSSIVQSGQDMATTLAEAKKRLEEHDPYEQLRVLIAKTQMSMMCFKK